MIYRTQISFPVDGTLAADAMTITPHYDGDDAQALANALKANLIASQAIGATKPFSIKVYDATKAPPSYPLAEASQAGTPPSSTTGPREVALCLSYYSLYNRPRFRGRMFIPHVFIGGQTGSRPTNQQMTDAMKWADALKAVTGASAFWVLYSRRDNIARPVTNVWVDDEWDIIRSRGRKPTTRLTASVP